MARARQEEGQLAFKQTVNHQRRSAAARTWLHGRPTSWRPDLRGVDAQGNACCPAKDEHKREQIWTSRHDHAGATNTLRRGFPTPPRRHAATALKPIRGDGIALGANQTRAKSWPTPKPRSRNTRPPTAGSGPHSGSAQLSPWVVKNAMPINLSHAAPASCPLVSPAGRWRFIRPPPVHKRPVSAPACWRTPHQENF